MKTLRTGSRFRRRGTTAVEFALALPVFLAFVFGIIECSRLRMTVNLLNTSCRLAARLGSAEDVTTATTRARVLELLSTAINTSNVTVLVKDASVYDEGGDLPETAEDYSSLPNLELSDAEPRQLFLVRASVGYNDIALIPFSCMQGVTLTGQAFIRHE